MRTTGCSASGNWALQRQALLDRHGRAEGGFDAVARAQPGDPGLDVLRQVLIGEDHIGPHRVAADRGAFDAAQHAAHRRLLAPGRVGVPGVLITVVGRIRILVDAHQPRMIRVAACDRMVFEFAEMPGESDMLGAGDVLVAEEQHLVLQEQGPDLGDQGRVAAGCAEIDVLKLRSDRAGELLHADRRAERRRRHDGRSADDRRIGCGRCHWNFLPAGRRRLSREGCPVRRLISDMFK